MSSSCGYFGLRCLDAFVSPLRDVLPAGCVRVVLEMCDVNCLLEGKEPVGKE